MWGISSREGNIAEGYFLRDIGRLRKPHNSKNKLGKERNKKDPTNSLAPHT